MAHKSASARLSLSKDRCARILIVDDDVVVRTYLECLLVENGYQVSMASDFSQVKDALSQHEFGLVIADILFPDMSYSGLDIVKYVASVYPRSKAIIITSYPSTHTAIAALRLHAVDYLPKPSSHDEILAAIGRAFDERDMYGGKGSLEKAESLLSKREHELLLLLFKGFSFSEVAETMGCSLATAKTYSRRIYKKLGVNSRSEAVHEAIGLRLIQHK